MLRKHLSVADGFVLYTTSVLGLGLIVLPSIAAREAGPWSILVWIGLAAVSYPMALTMAELGARYPSAGGVTSFISHGLGTRVGQLTGTMYLVAIAVGAPATALFFSEYLTKLIDLPGFTYELVAGAFLAALVVLNLFDVELTMRLQRWTFYGFLGAVTLGIVFSLFHVDGQRLVATEGYTLNDVTTTILVCFFAFVGWENAAFSGEEFQDSRTLVKALGAAVLAVALLFTALAVAVVGSLDRSTLAQSNASLADLLKVSLGAYAETASTIAALVIIFLMMISWVRGASRLVYNLSRDGLFPGGLAHVDESSGSPRRALAVVALVWALSLTVFALIGLQVEDYLRLASANFLITYVIIFAAAWRLLDRRRFLIPLTISTLAIVILVISAYEDLWYSAATVGLFVLLVSMGRRKGRGTNSPPEPQRSGAEREHPQEP